MELLYVWIEDYKNIKKQGFNFSPKHWFDFEYEEDNDGKVTGGTLKHGERNGNYPSDFFGDNISNVTAIVGKNGSGKTNLTDVISEFIASKWETKYTFSIWCQKHGENTIYHSTRLIKSDLNLSHELNLHSKLKHLNFSGILQYLPLGHRTTDLSTYNQLAQTQIKIPENNDTQHKLFQTIFNEYQFKEVTEQIKFFGKTSELLKTTLDTDLYIPKKLEVKLYRYGGNFYPKEEDPNTVTHNLANQIIYGFYISILENLCEHNSIHKSKIAYEEIINSYNEDLGAIASLNEFIKTHPLGGHSFNSNLFNQSKNALENIIQFIESEKYNFFSSLLNDFVKEEKFRDKFRIRIKDENSNVIEFINEIKACLGSLQHLISFQWEGLSYGENQVLKLCSSIYNTLQGTPDEIRPILLTIDEGELGFHAEWQRKYLPLVTNILKSLFPNFTFQVILTSHSPFLVSELPKENIIFLDKEKETGLCKVCKPEDMTHTFGANIHSLYRNSFFLENGLMGEFAKGKIDQVIKDLNQPEEDIPEERQKAMLFVIQQIGEPILKRKLKQMYDDKFHSLEQIDDRIKALEDEIKQLKRRQS